MESQEPKGFLLFTVRARDDKTADLFDTEKNETPLVAQQGL